MLDVEEMSHFCRLYPVKCERKETTGNDNSLLCCFMVQRTTTQETAGDECDVCLAVVHTKENICVSVLYRKHCKLKHT